MLRMGHDSMRAALIYQHASQTGDRRIADALDAVIEAAADSGADGETVDGRADDEDDDCSSHANRTKGPGAMPDMTKPQVESAADLGLLAGAGDGIRRVAGAPLLPLPCLVPSGLFWRCWPGAPVWLLLPVVDDRNCDVAGGVQVVAIADRGRSLSRPT